jgi:hypothetical protein
MRLWFRFVVIMLPLLALAACGGAIEARPVALQPAPTGPVVRATPGAALPGATSTAAPTVPVAETFVGRVADSEAFVAVIANGSEVTAYVCDGQALAAWFHGPEQAGVVELVDDDGAQLRAQISTGAGGAQLTRGTLRDEHGLERAFATDRATALTRAGLYRAEVAAAPGDAAAVPTVGVIVLGSGEFRGAYYADDRVTPVTDARINAESLTAIVPGVGTFEAARLSAPLHGHTPQPRARARLVVSATRGSAPPRRL